MEARDRSRRGENRGWSESSSPQAETIDHTTSVREVWGAELDRGVASVFLFSDVRVEIIYAQNCCWRIPYLILSDFTFACNQTILDITMAIPPLPIIWQKDALTDTYEKARVGRVFNARRPNRYPRAVVEATHPAHVQEAVQLANKLGCRASVRSGGHSWAAWSVRDDAILIDLGNMKHLEVDKEKKIVAASPSTTGMMLNEKLVPEGLLFCGGHCPDVGIGGFLLQGGMGWNCKVCGEIVVSLCWY